MHNIHFDCIDSTNSYAKKHYKSFPQGEITCISADEQTAGYGRQGHPWISKRGQDLLVTFYLQLTPIPPLALLLARALTRLIPNTEIKWPNDVLINGKKLAGCLAEVDPPHCCLGLGINVNSDDLSSIDQPATSLLLETGHPWDRKKLLHDLQHALTAELKRGFHPKDYPIAYLNQPVSLFDGKTTHRGLCHALNQDGAINLLIEGKVRTFYSGELRVAE